MSASVIEGGSSIAPLFSPSFIADASPSSPLRSDEDNRRRPRRDGLQRRQQRRTAALLLMTAATFFYLGRIGPSSPDPRSFPFPSATFGEDDNEYDLAAASVASVEKARLRSTRHTNAEGSAPAFSVVDNGAASVGKDSEAVRIPDGTTLQGSSSSRARLGGGDRHVLIPDGIGGKDDIGGGSDRHPPDGGVDDNVASPAVAPADVEQTLVDLRYLSLGTSTTWGAGLADRRASSYPNLLSSTFSTNAAQRAGGSLKYAAACTRSLVADAERRDGGFFDNGGDFDEGYDDWYDDDDCEEYDVVVIEYLVSASDGLIPLAKRLRRRFPRALMIFVRNWSPPMILDAKGRTVRQWWSEKRLGKNKNGGVLDGRETAYQSGPLHNEEFKAAFEEAASKGQFHWRPLVDQFAIQDEAVKEVGGYLLTMDRPDNIKDASEHLNLFADDWVHLSEAGHARIAEGVRDIIRRVLTEARWTPPFDIVLTSDSFGTWGSHRDHCHAWTETGSIPWRYSPNSRLEEFDTVQHKYALAVPGHFATIEIVNPEPTLADLYVGYMATGPFDEDDEMGYWRPHYPPTRAEILTQDWKLYATNDPIEDLNLITNAGDDGEPGMLLNPVVEGYGYPVHVSLTSYVGVIEPGTNTVVFRPMVHGGKEIMPFRLVSTSIISRSPNEEGSGGTEARPGGVHFEGGAPATPVSL